MFVRIRFSKFGVIKFIGHLDMMRYFQKAVRRSGLQIKYSQGYSPHQLMVFASPLGVGITSDGEIMDIEIEDTAPECSMANPAEAVADTLSKGLTEGVEIVSAKIIPWTEGEKHPDNAMSLVTAADYLVSLKDGYDLKLTDGTVADAGYLREKFEKYIALGEHVVEKKTKSGVKELDVKPYIYEFDCITDKSQKLYEAEDIRFRHADIYESGIRFVMKLAAGSSINIKPELIMEDFCSFAGIEYNGFAFQIHRGAMYTDDNGEKVLL